MVLLAAVKQLLGESDASEGCATEDLQNARAVGEPLQLSVFFGYRVSSPARGAI